MGRCNAVSGLATDHMQLLADIRTKTTTFDEYQKQYLILSRWINKQTDTGK